MEGNGSSHVGGGENDVAVEREDATVGESLLDALRGCSASPRVESERGERISIDQLSQRRVVPLEYVLLLK